MNTDLSPPLVAVEDLPPEEVKRLMRSRKRGEQYDRSDMIEEIRRRGIPLALELGFPTSPSGKLRCRYYGNNTTLQAAYENRLPWTEVTFDEWLADDLPFIIESYEVPEKWTDEALVPDYDGEGNQASLNQFFEIDEDKPSG